MVRAILAGLCLLRGATAPAPRPGVVAGWLQTPNGDPAVAPRPYRVRVPQVPDAMPSCVAVGWDDTTLQLSR